MVLPRFTLRAGLLWLTVAAFLSVAAREALGGAPWGVGVVAAVALTALSFALQGVAYGAALALSRRDGDSSVGEPR